MAVDAQEAESPIVYVVDDDQSIRESLEDLLASIGLRAATFASPKEFSQSERPDAPSCLVLDVRMPGVSGLEFQEELTRSGIRMSIIFITAHGDVPMSVKAMKAGAVDFLTKPFREQDLVDAIQNGLARDLARRRAERVQTELRRRYASLSDGEKEVMKLAVSGLLNKQIAAQLGLSEVTIKMRRGQVMRKMRADSFADLVRFYHRIDGSEEDVIELK
ncbi:response regulator transcription factor [Methylosinus sporium]|uniref:response regulator transcription factor n=1 Tax=Methylosinus sporium TaxID=428 RepID=UPI00383B2A3F